MKSEQCRANLPGVAIAAGKRLSESLRCLEEYGKLIDAAFAARIEQLRYRGYAIESALHERLGAGGAKQWRVCVLITESLCTHRAWLDVARAALDGGADCLQLREKRLDDAELLSRARKLIHSAKGRADVIVNDRADIALAAGAAGVHLGQGDLPIADVRRMAGRSLLIGASTHSIAEAKHAVAAGCDYCGVGAMFATTTKDRRPSGIKYLRAYLKSFPHVPHLAIGGITSDNINELVEAGCRGVAVSAAVCGATRPATVVRRLRHALPK
jgi:thiamine-phosphate pyrophosphorylase